MGDLLGYVLFALLVPVAAFHGAARKGAPGAFGYGLAVAAHAAIAIAALQDIFFSVASDSLAFHVQAVDMMSGLGLGPTLAPSSRNWSYAISILYSAFGVSTVLVMAINQWLFFFALVQLGKLVEEAGWGRFQSLIVLLFALTPASLLNCNFLLRESFQVFVLIYAFRKMDAFRKTGRAAALFWGAIALVPFGLIHNGFFLLVPVLLGYAVFGRIFFPGGAARRRSPVATVFSILLGVAVVALALIGTSSFSENRRYAQLVNGDLDIAAQIGYAVSALDARTAFPWYTDTSGLGIVWFAPIQLWQFLFAPLFPFLIQGPADVVAAVDAGLRIALLFGCWRAYRRGDRETRARIRFLLGGYLLICVIASLGTSTVGTAMRHQLKAFWLIAAAGVPGILGASPARRPASLPRPGRALPPAPPAPAAPKDPPGPSWDWSGVA